MTPQDHDIQNYGVLAIFVLGVALSVLAVILVSVAHAVQEWNPAEATKIRRAASVLSAIGHGVEGLVLKWPGTADMPLSLVKSAEDVAKKDGAS